jgi:hypothetical protein
VTCRHRRSWCDLRRELAIFNAPDYAKVIAKMKAAVAGVR